jgi:hypothetical protein
MISSLSRAIAAFRVWLGLNDPAENRLHPSHGWLLPLADRRVPAVALAPALSPVSPALGKRP